MRKKKLSFEKVGGLQILPVQKSLTNTFGMVIADMEVETLKERIDKLKQENNSLKNVLMIKDL